MIKKLNQWLELPEVEGDDEKTYHIRLVITTTNILLVILPVIMIGNLLDGRNSLNLVIADIVTLVGTIVIRQWTIAKKETTAGIIMIGIGYFVATLMSVISGTIPSSAMVIFVVWAVQASLVFGAKGFLFSIILVSACIGGVMIAENSGWLPPADHSVRISEWVKSVFELILVTGMAFSSRHITHQAFRKAQQELEERKRAEDAMLIMSEREKMGRNLHDGLGQSLGYISMQARTSAILLHEGQTAEAEIALHRLEEAANDAAAEVRLHILGLKSEEGTPSPKKDFFEALRAYVNQYQNRYQIEVNLSLPEDTSTILIAPEAEESLLKVVQEAMTNAAKHSKTNLVTITLQSIHDSVQIMISDHGIGFVQKIPQSSPQTDSEEPHFGLQIMRKRMEQIFGTFEIRSTPGKGTLVLLTLPRFVSVATSYTSLKGIRILLADDHPLFLDGLRNMLIAHGLTVIGTAENGQEAYEKAIALNPDVLLMDLNMPVLNGLEATRRIKAEMPEAKIVILTVSDDDENLYHAILNGASGFLLKNMHDDQLLTLLFELTQGETPLSTSVSTRLVNLFSRVAGLSEYVEETSYLTPQQNKILQFVKNGKTYKEIGILMGLSAHTVKYHMGQILRRLNLNSREEALNYLEEHTKKR